MLTNLNLTDMETCYKAFRREVLAGIELEEDRFGIEPELTAKVARNGWRIYEVGISYDGRTYAEGKKVNWKDGLWALWCLLRYSAPGDRVRQAVGRAARPPGPPTRGTARVGRGSAGRGRPEPREDLPLVLRDGAGGEALPSRGGVAVPRVSHPPAPGRPGTAFT